MHDPVSSVSSSKKKAQCLVLISNDPRENANSLEGLRCAIGLSGDSRWDVAIGFYGKAIGFVDEFLKHPNDSSIWSHPVLRQWSQSPGNWYYYATSLEKDGLNPSLLNTKLLDGEGWLELGISQSKIFSF